MTGRKTGEPGETRFAIKHPIGVPDTPAGLVAARSSALRELVRLIYDRSKFSPPAFAGERSSLALVVDAAEDHWQRMHAAALGFPRPTGDTEH